MTSPAVTVAYKGPSLSTLRSHLPSRASISHYYQPLSTFASQRDAGLSSGNFDIEAANIAGGDSRAGLDEEGAREVREIMRREGLTFDQARLKRQRELFAQNGVDAFGFPLDPKAVTRL